MMLKKSLYLYLIPIAFLTACSHIGVQEGGYCVGSVNTTIAGLRAEASDKLMPQASALAMNATFLQEKLRSFVTQYFEK